MIADKINDYLNARNLSPDDAILASVADLSAFAFKRQFMEDGQRNYLGLSGCGHCLRQQWYQHNATPVNGKIVDARGRVTFWLGDAAEIVVTHLALLAGVRIVGIGRDQDEVVLRVGETELRGHPDGVVFCDDGKTRLFECKSMSSFGFKEFEEGNISEDYRAQQNMYMDLLGLDESVMVAVAKDSGVIREQILVRDPALVETLVAGLETVVTAGPHSPPPRKFAPNEKRVLPWNCTYCSWWGECWPGAEQVLVRGRYALQTAKVEE